MAINDWTRHASLVGQRQMRVRHASFFFDAVDADHTPTLAEWMRIESQTLQHVSRVIADWIGFLQPRAPTPGAGHEAPPAEACALAA